MASCTFFGHKEIHFEKLTDNLILILTNLIVNKEVDTFFVGNQGDFDKTVLCVLRKLKSQFRHIKFSVVLAYHPSLRARAFRQRQLKLFNKFHIPKNY